MKKKLLVVFASIAVISIFIDFGASQVHAQYYPDMPLGPDTVRITEPQFPDGQKALLEYLKKKMKYPEDALKDSVQGRVIVQFTVEKDGSISNPKIVKRVSFMPDPADSVKVRMFDTEAIRLISEMPKWTPGKKNGEPCRIFYNIPVSFKLDFNASNNADTPGQFITFEEH